jgi:hypothetical protein
VVSFGPVGVIFQQKATVDGAYWEFWGLLFQNERQIDFVR